MIRGAKVLIGNAAVDEGGRVLTNLPVRNLYGCQGRPEVGRFREVVASDDRQVFGYFQAASPGRMHSSDRRFVIQAEQSCRWTSPTEHLSRRVMPEGVGIHSMRRRGDRRLPQRIQTRFLQGALVTLKPSLIGCGLRRLDKNADALMSESCQMLSSEVADELVVDRQ